MCDLYYVTDKFNIAICIYSVNCNFQILGVPMCYLFICLKIIIIKYFWFSCNFVRVLLNSQIKRPIKDILLFFQILGVPMCYLFVCLKIIMIKYFWFSCNFVRDLLNTQIKRPIKGILLFKYF